MELLKSLLYKATHKPDGEYINPLAHVFFYITFIFGAAFTFFGYTDTVRTAVLYAQSERQFGSWSLSAWGVCAMIVTVWNTYIIIARKPNSAGAMLGFMLWLYAVLIYLSGDFYFQILVAAVPNLIFWGWWYIRLRRFFRISAY